MSIADWFKKDPTSHWPLPRLLPLVLDLSRQTLNGIPFGAPADRLAALGRPDNKRPFKENLFLYKQAGLAVGLEDGRVDSFEIATVRDPWDSHDLDGRAVELVAPNGGRQHIDQQTPSTTIIRALGEPAETDRDEYETLLFYRTPAYRLEVACSLQDRVTRLYFLDPGGTP